MKSLGFPTEHPRRTLKKPIGNWYGSITPISIQTTPIADLAQEKMKEINEAYDTLTKGGAGASHTAYSSGGSYSGTSGRFEDIRRMIQMGQLDAAESALESRNSRTAEWYFLRGVIAKQRGWMDEARQNFTIAVNMDPSNMEYRSALGASGAGAYSYRQQQYGNTQEDQCCDLCSTLMCLNCLCNCCR